MDQQNQGKKWYKRWWFIIPTAVIVVVVLASAGGSDTSTSDTSVNSAISLGDEGYLRISNSDVITVLKTKEAFEEFTKSAVANDTYGMAKLVTDGQGFNVAVGTKVKVIDSDFAVRKVRILDGEHAMKDGWVAKEFIQKE